MRFDLSLQNRAGYRGSSLEFLTKRNLSPGDMLSIRKGGVEYVGSLLPRYEHADENYITIKLLNGYNIGVKVSNIESVSKLSDGTKPLFARPTLPRLDSSLPRIVVMGTGGTIASRIDYKTGAVHPAFSTEDIYAVIPEISRYAQIDTVAVLNEYSENIATREWRIIAEAIADKISGGADGIVVSHGTDTMAYTAAALSFALIGSPVPIILVGSQRSTDRPSSDAALNMIAAVLVASRPEFSGVYLAMHSSSNDDSVSIHLGTKVRKNHTSRRDAFESINIPPVATVNGERIQRLGLPKEGKASRFALRPGFEEKVALLKFHPGFDPDLIDYLRTRGYKGLVLEGTGLGHVSAKCYEPIRRAVQSGILVGMTSQCIWGRVRMTVYSTGRDLMNLGVIPLDDMLPETAQVKMMWAIKNSHDFEDARNTMIVNIAGELVERSPVDRRQS
ncbi:MAG: Glu-tRNA(Gln) amidotransferase subunit GatD [Nitrososphaerales archaeon]